MKKILTILTGGTFGMAASEDKSLRPAQIDDRLHKLLPELKSLADISFKTAFNIDSSDMLPSHWQGLADIIEEEIDNYDGFVIIHGTDTMSYTASALSYMFVDLPKPVVLTGSQRPLGALRSDAKSNFIDAIEFATLDIPEVGVCFHHKLYRGNRTKKMNTEAFDAFQSPNFEWLAKAGISIKRSEKIRQPDGLFSVRRGFDPSVISLPIFPGMRAADYMVLTKSNINAIILEAFGAGNVPILDNSMIPLIEALVAAGKLVAIKSECVEGSTDMCLYEGGKLALEAGALSCGDMTREAALVKLMFLFGNLNNLNRIKKSFTTSLAGELT